MKPNCYIDFDGTCVSNEKRLYQFFIDHIPDANKLPIEEFWALKKLGVNEAEWANAKLGIHINIQAYNTEKKRVIETEQYLQYDELLSNTLVGLTKLAERYNLVLVTRRSNEIGFYNELKRLGLENIFQSILVIPHGETTKAVTIRERENITVDDIMVGDTEDDLLCAKALNIPFYFVLSGIRGKWLMIKYPYEKMNCVKDISGVM